MLDWEVSSQDLEKARKAYGSGGEKYVHTMNANHCNKLLGKDFRGIERFYPPEVIVDAHQAKELIVGIQEGQPYSVSKDQLNKGKDCLKRRILKIDSIENLKELLNVVMDIDQIYRQDGRVQLTIPGFRR